MSANAADGCFLLKADIDAADAVLRRLRTEPPVDPAPAASALRHAIEAVLGTGVARIDATVGAGTFRWIATARLADGRAVVLRLNRLDRVELTHGLEVERTVGALVRGSGVRLPAVLAIDVNRTLLPAPFAILERIDGPSLAAVDADEEAALRAVRSLGAWLGRLHAVPVSAPIGPLHPGARGRGDPDWYGFLTRRLELHLTQCLAAGLVSGAEAAAVHELFERPASFAGVSAGSLLHGDSGGSNVILDDGGAVRALVDWEDALVGDPLFDLASAAAFQPERRWSALFEGYADSGVDAPIGERFWLYFLRIALARTVMRLRFGVMDRPGRAPAAERIQRALRALQTAEVAA